MIVPTFCWPMRIDFHITEAGCASSSAGVVPICNDTDANILLDHRRRSLDDMSACLLVSLLSVFTGQLENDT